ncbi:MAG: helix-turn-helix transcriptional regulator [Spirochaetes bacterium]|nr:helix-turn-helix transcriptional regulator [Spirochaetota bacterium]
METPARDVKNAFLAEVVRHIPIVDLDGFAASITIFHRHDAVDATPTTWHTHPYYEFSLVRSGVINYGIRTKPLIRRAGEVFFMPPNTVHRWHASRVPASIDGFMLEFFHTDTARAAFIDSLPALSERMNYRLKMPPAVRARFAEIDREIMGGELYAVKRTALLIHDIIYLTIRHNFAEALSEPAVEDAKRVVANEREMRLFLAAKQYIEHHFAEHISPADVAREINVSPRYTNYVFSRAIGRPCGKYLQERRLIEAYHLLQFRTGIKVREIARMVGFTDHYYFTRAFTKQFRVPPTGIRARAFM